MENKLPIFLQNKSIREIFETIKKSIPIGTKVYLFAGAIRNAVYFHYFNEELNQRDYDCIVIGDGETFANNLIKNGFIFGPRNSNKSKVFLKNKVDFINGKEDIFELDCKIYPSDENIISVLERIIDFTINGVALDFEYIDSPNWMSQMFTLPNFMEDIKNKKLVLLKVYRPSIYKIIRLVYSGFQKPSQIDIKLCLEELKKITEDTFEHNKGKVLKNIHNNEEIQKVTKNLGIKFNVLSFNDIKNS